MRFEHAAAFAKRREFLARIEVLEEMLDLNGAGARVSQWQTAAAIEADDLRRGAEQVEVDESRDHLRAARDVDHDATLRRKLAKATSRRRGDKRFHAGERGVGLDAELIEERPGDRHARNQPAAGLLLDRQPRGGRRAIRGVDRGAHACGASNAVCTRPRKVAFSRSQLNLDSPRHHAVLPRVQQRLAIRATASGRRRTTSDRRSA